MKLRSLSSLALAVLCLSPFTLFAKKNTYEIDPSHTYVAWRINHFGFSNPTGKWMAEGTLVYDDEAPEDSKAKITIKLADIITGDPELDKHLKGKQFFEVDTFPKAIFVSDKVMVSNKKIREITGNLTLHGVTKPITIKVRQNKIDKNPITDKPTLGFSGDLTLNRSDFDIKTLIPGISDQVKLNIEVEAFREPDPEPKVEEKADEKADEKVDEKIEEKKKAKPKPEVRMNKPVKYKVRQWRDDEF